MAHGPKYDPTNVKHSSGIPLAYQPSTHKPPADPERCTGTYEAGIGTVQCGKPAGHERDASRGGTGHMWHWSPRGGENGMAWPA